MVNSTGGPATQDSNTLKETLQIIQDRLWNRYLFFQEYRVEWEDDWLRGPTSAYVAGLLEDLFFFLYYRVMRLKTLLSRISDDLDDLFDETFLSDLIDDIWSDWSNIIEGGKDWVNGKIEDLWEDWYWFRQDPAWMIEFWLVEALGWFEAIGDDAENWVNEQIEGFWPDWYWFRQDPAWMIEFWLTETFPSLPDVLTDPRSWFEDRLDAGMDRIRAWMLDRLMHMIENTVRRRWEVGEPE